MSAAGTLGASILAAGGGTVRSAFVLPDSTTLPQVDCHHSGRVASVVAAGPRQGVGGVERLAVLVEDLEADLARHTQPNRWWAWCAT